MELMRLKKEKEVAENPPQGLSLPQPIIAPPFPSRLAMFGEKKVSFALPSTDKGEENPKIPLPNSESPQIAEP